jgi:hypothetical protein
MAPNAQAKTKGTKSRTVSGDKTTAPATIPERELMRTPPPASTPIAGTPILQPASGSAPPANTVSTPPQAATPIMAQQSDSSSPSQQTAMQTPHEMALSALDIAIEYLIEPYQKAVEKVKQGQDPSTIVIETPYRVHEKIGRNIVSARDYIKKDTLNPDNIEKRFNHLEEMLKEVMTAISAKSYAQATAIQVPEINRTREIQQRNLDRKVEERREQNKFEVTLTTQGADPNTKDQLAQQTHEEITAKLQQTVKSQMKDNPITIQGIQKLKSRDIRIHCDTEKDAEQLRKLQWDESYSGLKTRQRKFGIIIDGVSTKTINPKELQNPETAKKLEEQNEGKELQIIEMRPLRRKLREDVQDYSLVIFTSNPKTANNFLKHGIYINHERFNPRKYSPQFQLIQCYKCQQFGHHAIKCRSPHDVCAKCSEHHPTSQCHNEAQKCAGCKQEHPAYHEHCPKKLSALESNVIRKHNDTGYFDE